MSLNVRTVLVVAGGIGSYWVEILDPTQNNRWIQGPNLPYRCTNSVLVTSPTNNNKISQIVWHHGMEHIGKNFEISTWTCSMYPNFKWWKLWKPWFTWFTKVYFKNQFLLLENNCKYQLTKYYIPWIRATYTIYIFHFYWFQRSSKLQLRKIFFSDFLTMWQGHVVLSSSSLKQCYQNFFVKTARF